jgi:hypothetical protein
MPLGSVAPRGDHAISTFADLRASLTTRPHVIVEQSGSPARSWFREVVFVGTDERGPNLSVWRAESRTCDASDKAGALASSLPDLDMVYRKQSAARLRSASLNSAVRVRYTCANENACR